MKVSSSYSANIDVKVFESIVGRVIIGLDFDIGEKTFETIRQIVAFFAKICLLVNTRFSMEITIMTIIDDDLKSALVPILSKLGHLFHYGKNFLLFRGFLSFLRRRNVGVFLHVLYGIDVGTPTC